MALYTTNLLFNERSLMCMTRFQNPPEALEAFEIRLSSSASRLLMLATWGFRLLLFLKMRLIPGSLSVCLGQCLRPRRVLVQNLCFLEFDFQPKWIFIGDYFLCIVCATTTVLSASMATRTRTFLVFLVYLN